jgi:hypothetical protein
MTGSPVGVSVHDFAPGADVRRAEEAWRTRLAGPVRVNVSVAGD